MGSIFTDKLANPPPPEPPMPRWLKRLLIIGTIGVVVIGGLVTFAGFVHFVPSHRKFCAKESWGLKDTFIDPDEFIGRTKLELIDRITTIRALELCGVLTDVRPKKNVDRDFIENQVQLYKLSVSSKIWQGACDYARKIANALEGTDETAKYESWRAAERDDCRRAAAPGSAPTRSQLALAAKMRALEHAAVMSAATKRKDWKEACRAAKLSVEELVLADDFDMLQQARRTSDEACKRAGENQ